MIGGNDISKGQAKAWARERSAAISISERLRLKISSKPATAVGHTVEGLHRHQHQQSLIYRSSAGRAAGDAGHGPSDIFQW